MNFDLGPNENPGAGGSHFAHVLAETGVRCSLRGLGTADAPAEPLQVRAERERKRG
jgi:hypothetical protein